MTEAGDFVSRRDVLAARNFFLAVVCGSVAVIIIIHVFARKFENPNSFRRFIPATVQQGTAQVQNSLSQGQLPNPSALSGLANQTIGTARQAAQQALQGQPLSIPSYQPAPPSDKDREWRKLCTVFYFAALLLGCWGLAVPRSEFMHKLYSWSFADCPPTLKRTWTLYLHSLDIFINRLVCISAIFIATTGIYVMSYWSSAFSMLDSVFNIVWWCSGIALVVYPFVGGHWCAQAVQRRRMLDEQLITISFVARRLSEPDREQEVSTVSPVQITGPLCFRAGGFDWSWDDFQKSCVIFGDTGTGKTVCVLNSVLEGLLGSGNDADQKASALILDPKGDFSGKIATLCRRYGRSDDLLILDPAQPGRTIRWNPLDSDDDELELAARFAAVMEIMGVKDKDNSFWIDSAKKFIRHSISLIRMTNPAGVPPAFVDILQLATSFEAIVERTDALDVAQELHDPTARVEQTLSFFANEWAGLADETRTSIQAYVTNMIDPFLMAPYSTIFAGRSTMGIGDMLERGKILYVNMPIADKEAMAKMSCTFVKLAYFKEVLKRINKPRPSLFLCDEFQAFFTIGQGKSDADFFERSRQSRHANIIATQNLPALLKQAEKRDPVDNLLGHCLVKIFLRNGNPDTNEYASKLFGQQIVDFTGTSAGGGPGGGLGGRKGAASMGQSTTSQYDAKVRPEEFFRLSVPARTPGRDFCESIVHLSTRVTVSKQKLRWKVHPLTE